MLYYISQGYVQFVNSHVFLSKVFFPARILYRITLSMYFHVAIERKFPYKTNIRDEKGNGFKARFVI